MASTCSTSTGEGPDPVPENNRRRLLVGVRGPSRCSASAPRVPSGSPALLAKGGIKVKALPASQCNWTLEELAGYSGVLLENTPASLVGHVGMENLAAWVAQSGGGLMITGGKDSYGPGGYYKSPLEPVMPVSMELRREHRKLSVAIVVALDRSGSMAMPGPDGRPKIQLADLATAEVIDMLGPTDQFGCIAVDTIPHTIVPLSDVTDKAGHAGPGPAHRLRRAAGIYIYVALTDAARMIAPAKAGTKHIVLFSDAADAEEPGDYKPLVAEVRQGGHHRQRRRAGHGEGLRRRAARRTSPGGAADSACSPTWPRSCPGLFAQDTLLDRPQRVLGRPGDGPRRPAGWRPSRGRPWAIFPRSAATTLLLPEPGRESGRHFRRRVPGAGAGRLAGRPGTGAVLCGRGRREVYRRDGRLEERGRLLHLAGPLDGRQVAESSAGAWSPRRNCGTASAASSCTSILPGRRTLLRACRS